jgi:cobalt-zinc-cadmium efflux system protein
VTAPLDSGHCDDHRNPVAGPTAAGPAHHPGHDDHPGHTDHSDHAGHSHAISPEADVRYLWTALSLFVAFMLLEIVVAVASGSLVLLADAGHMLSDAGAIAGALWAIRLAARPASGRWTFGLKRAEILSAAGNGLTLLVVGLVIAIEAIRRLVDPPDVGGSEVLVVALIGVAVNLVATWVLTRADRRSMNVRGAYAHVLTDLYAFIGTAVAGLIIVLTGWTRADGVASLVVVALMLHAAWGLLRDSGRVLLEGAPDHMDLDVVRQHMLDLPEVAAVHDLHVWTLTSQLQALSAHVVVVDDCFHHGFAPQVLDRLQHCLGGHFDIEHSTFQLEPASHTEHESGAHH